jgi:hypothetical protein
MSFIPQSPTEVTNQVILLLKKFSERKYKLVYVPVKSEPTSIKSECYNNVREKIKSADGKIRFGWSVYDNGYFIEAEKHAIWESLEGDLIDVSPNEENIHTIMFIMDDINDGIYVPNIRCNYKGLQSIDDYFTIYDTLDVLTLYYAKESDIVKGMFVFPPQLTQSVKAVTSLITEYSEYINSNIANCICGSNILYENCHSDKFVQGVINHIDRVIIENNLKKNIL